MARLIGFAAILAGLIVFMQYYGPQDTAYVRGATWAFGPQGFFFYVTAGLVAFMAAHRGGKALTLAPLLFVGVGALFVLLEAWGARIPFFNTMRAPVIFALGLAIAYGPKPPEWLSYGAAAVGGALCGYLAGQGLGAQFLEWRVLAGFFTSLAIFLLAGMIIADLCSQFRNGGSIRARLGAAAAGIGLYLTLRVFGVLPGGLLT